MISEDSKPISIAIDGPAGAGKSTTARMLAAQLGYVYVDSGAMYRAIAWRCDQAGIPAENATAVVGLARDTEISFRAAVGASGEQKVLADDEDISKAIRSPEISSLASTISANPQVRELLVAKQRTFGEKGGIVMEGRDIGTVVLPNAEVKVFLTASLDERARRRFLEFEQKGATNVTFERVRDEMAQRDKRDSTRAVSPLMPAVDSVILDSEEMTAGQVVDAILDICTARMSKPAPA